VPIYHPSTLSLISTAWLFAAVLGLGASAHAADSPATNHPPEFGHPIGIHSPERRATLVPAGRTLEYRIEAFDPDGDAVTFEAKGLPEFAKLDPRQGILSLAPAANERGSHRIQVDVSDGRAVSRFVLMVTVSANQAPAVNAERLPPFIVGSRQTRRLALFVDPEHDPLTVVSARVPKGASVAATGHEVELAWQPTDADVGEHPYAIEVSDGLLRSRLEGTLFVVPSWRGSDWSTRLVPSFGTAAFVTHAGDAYAGGTFDLTLFARRRPAHEGIACVSMKFDGDCNASHLRLYANFELLESPTAGGPALFSYSFGYAGSFESYPVRRYLIPFYAFEFGGLFHEGLGHYAGIRPELGVYLWADHRAWLRLSIGERLLPTELTQLSGPTLSLSAMLVPW
jgi:hypothetical protein